MNMYDATEIAYQNGYKQGYKDAQCANTILCNICVSKPVCCIYRATGGILKCRHFHKEDEINGERTNLS